MLAILFATIAVEPPKPGLKVGQTAPPVDALFADGSPFDQKGQEGKFVLMTWWTTDDDETRRHFARMRELRKEFVSEKRLQMISLRVGGEWEEWLKFEEKQPPHDPKHPMRPFFSDFKWWQAYHHPTTTDRRNPFRVGKKPESFLIGPDGKFVALNIPDEKLRETVVKAVGRR